MTDVADPVPSSDLNVYQLRVVMAWDSYSYGEPQSSSC